MAAPITGECLCGAIKYSIRDTSPLPKLPANYCHCTQCRRATGAQHGTFIAVPKESLHLSGCTLKRFQSSAIAQRAFCTVRSLPCGVNPR